ncbi:MAG TPA: hypothetical protein VGP76_20675 [Planctomycetaceae bacterium]|jgi:hypothetical protein|nr:hypothetical protein [Planctomycetaceae bacterium]
MSDERSAMLIACLSICCGVLLVFAGYRLHKQVSANRSVFFVPEYGEHLLVALGLSVGGIASLCLGMYLVSLLPT